MGDVLECAHDGLRRSEEILSVVASSLSFAFDDRWALQVLLRPDEATWSSLLPRLREATDIICLKRECDQLSMLSSSDVSRDNMYSRTSCERQSTRDSTIRFAPSCTYIS